MLTAWGCVGLSIAIGIFPFTSAASAETRVRAQGRCKLTSEAWRSPLFDGHCIVKQKQQGNTSVFIVELDNGAWYRFFGPSKESLQVETHHAIHNVSFDEESDRGVFTWMEDGARQRLFVRLDSRHPVGVSHDDNRKTSVGEAIAAVAVGALIAGLLGGERNSSAPDTDARIGQPVRSLQDLVGARGGQAETGLKRRGYEYRRGTQQADSAFSYWFEPQTKNCIAIRTTDGRYAAIVYTDKQDCDR